MTEAAINLPFPVSVNALFMNVYRRGRVKTPAYREWLEEAGWMLKSQPVKPFDCPVEIHAVVCPPDKRKRDLDNLWKCVLDLLCQHKIIKDDSFDCVRALYISWVEDGKPCTVTVRAAA
jgi:crossover junction endodeoxyribonuclease RusA